MVTDDGRAPFTLRYTSLLLSPERQRGVIVFAPHSSVISSMAQIDRAFMPADLDIPRPMMTSVATRSLSLTAAAS